MAKIKITTLTDKIKDDEILSKLKSIGVKIKDKEKEKEEQALAEKKTSTASGETVIEKRVASTVIRRRVQTPPAEVKEAAKETEAPAVEATAARRKGQPAAKAAAERKAAEEPVIELVKPEKPGKASGRPQIEMIERVDETRKAEAAEKKSQAAAKAEQQGAPIAEEAKAAEETAKTEADGIAEEKKQEITRALEEVYKQDLHKEFALVEDEGTEEERKKKKAERLAKKIEEEEIEEAKLKGKGTGKRKVIIKEEDLYAFRRQKGKTLPFRRDRGRREDRAEEDRRAEGVRPARKVVKVAEQVQVGELAKKLSLKASDVIAKLLRLGTISNVNQNIDYDTAYLVATDAGFDVERIMSVEEEFMTREDEQQKAEVAEDLKPRPPVVTIMGHVDHGKTLLLDTIRNTNVAEHEAGGITQHIGAYIAKVDKKEITFVDTPGHEAFTAMRARGALVTDIVVLVVAADDGVMPQTREAIDHAKAAGVPIIVAVNKIDKANANPDKVMKELTELGLQPEEWGGTTLAAKISAKKKTGIEELLELILLQAEHARAESQPGQAGEGDHHRVGSRQGARPVRHRHHPGRHAQDPGPVRGGDGLRQGQGVGRRQGQEDTEGAAVDARNGGRLLRRAEGGRFVHSHDGGALRQGGLPLQAGEDEGAGAGQERPRHP